jgi:ABC-2 type transport system permease protein
MTVETVATAAAPSTRRGTATGAVWLVRDSWVEAIRHLRAMPRNPELLAFAAAQPIMFVVLFVYVLGGSIAVPGYPRYEQYLIPGILAQTVLWGTSFTSLGLAEDLSKGFVDRLRSMPISPAAIIVGRTISDAVRNAVTLVITVAFAFLVGFRLESTPLEAAQATLLLLAFSYAFSWIQAWIGLSVKSVEAANSAGLLWMFPLTFVSSAYVDPATMPGWMQPLAEHNPFTTLTDATRALYNGHSPGNDAWIALAWAAGITVVFAVVAARRFASVTDR